MKITKLGQSAETVKTATRPYDSLSTEQHWHPVIFWSRRVQPAEQNYSVGEQELLAIVILCKYWHHYLESIRYLFTVLTDHENLKWFLTKKSLTGCKTHWWEALSVFDINIIYQPGKYNSIDRPLRCPDYQESTHSLAGTFEFRLPRICNADIYHTIDLTIKTAVQDWLSATLLTTTTGDHKQLVVYSVRVEVSTGETVYMEPLESFLELLK